MRARVALLAFLLLAACGRAATVKLPDGDAGISIPDAGITDNDAGITNRDAGITDGDAGITTWKTARVALHVHSAIAHDACDGHSKDGGSALGDFDQACIAQLKEAFCATRLDVVLMTDHPRFMDGLTFLDDLIYQPSRGEELVSGGDGAPVANRLRCDDGREPLLTVGYEGTHTMPLGLRRHLADQDLYGVHTDVSTPMADMQRALEEVHAAGGIYFTAHSEEPDLSLQILRDLKTDGMEWYNVHGNLLQLYESDQLGGTFDLAHVQALIDGLKGLDPFLQGATGADKPHADLIYLELLRTGFPLLGLQKWHDVLGSRFIAGGLGNDVHQNVSIKPICKGAVAMAACQAVGALYPNVLTSLANGGPVVLNDGERMDSYARVLRWLNNRALVREVTVDEVVAAMGAGRSYGIFAVFGEPGPFAFWAEQGGARIEMGGTAAAGLATLRVRLPDPPAPELGARWTAADAKRAGLRAVLWRTTASGRTAAAEWTAFGSTVDFAAALPGAYSLEVWLVPRHLESALGRAGSLAAVEYRWLISNAIIVQ